MTAATATAGWAGAVAADAVLSTWAARWFGLLAARAFGRMGRSMEEGAMSVSVCLSLASGVAGERVSCVSCELARSGPFRGKTLPALGPGPFNNGRRGTDRDFRDKSLRWRAVLEPASARFSLPHANPTASAVVHRRSTHLADDDDGAA